MRPKLLLCLALVLSGDWFGDAQNSTNVNQWPGFPILPAITNANPSVRHKVSVRVPTKLKIERTADTLSVTIDTNSFESTNLLVGTNMVTGLRSDWYVYPLGQARPAKGGVGLSDLLDIGGMVNYWHTEPDGIPQASKIYMVEIDLTAFETDIPPQHMWNPYDKNYRVIWQRTLKQTVN